MNPLYVLEYHKLLEGYKQPVFEYYDSIEQLLADVEEHGLLKDSYKIHRFLYDKVLDAQSVLSAFSQEVGEY